VSHLSKTVPNSLPNWRSVAASMCLLAALWAAPSAVAQDPPRSETASAHRATHPAETRSAAELREHDVLNHIIRDTFTADPGISCTKLTTLYRETLIPKAEAAKYPRNKAEFLGNAYSSIGDCQASEGRYIDAEKSFRDALEQAEVWPGKSNSMYAEMWDRLAHAQLKQDHFHDAAISELNVADAYPAVIAAMKKEFASGQPGTAPMHKMVLRNLEQRRANATAYAAYYQSRDGDLDAAAKSAEQAYTLAVAAGVTGEWLNFVIRTGAHVAELSDNADDRAKWAARADTSQAGAAAPAPTAGPPGMAANPSEPKP
jgi:tetratricopeptide (TPR) repeat protein